MLAPQPTKSPKSWPLRIDMPRRISRLNKELLSLVTEITKYHHCGITARQLRQLRGARHRCLISQTFRRRYHLFPRLQDIMAYFVGQHAHMHC